MISMKCEKVQNLISTFLDGELAPETWESVETHIAQCDECERVYSDFSLILDLCEESFAADDVPPNSQALWCRINNIIETEVVPEIQREEAESTTPGRLASFWNGSLWLSKGQVATAVVGIAVVSSLLTVIAVRNFSNPVDPLAESETEPTIFEKVMADLGVGESPAEKTERRVKEQKAAIDYWKNRVEMRRASWNPETRDVFDRNLDEIDKAVREYTRLLQENPQDAISNEMLDSALKEKMDLLREFSEL